MTYLSNDPTKKAQEEQMARSALVRTAVIWTPLFALSGGALLYFLAGQLFDFGNGTWFLVVVLSILSFLFGYQAIGALRDLAGGTAEMRGIVTKRWSRSDSIVMRTHYIRIEGKIFRINKLLHGDVKQGDEVSIRFYPASMLVVSLERHTNQQKSPDDPKEDSPARDVTVAGGYRLDG